MLTNKFSLIILLLSFQLYNSRESTLDFLDSKTIDVLRQIYWSTIELISNEQVKSVLKEEDFFNNNRTQLIFKIKNISNSFNLNYDEIKENKIFAIKVKEDTTRLLRNDNIPKNFLINFAFNLDKYFRTENQEINGMSDYLNYIQRRNLKQNILIEKILQKKSLLEPDNFKKYILNDINFDFCDIDTYIKSKSKKELIQLIYSFERYCFSYDNEENSICQIPYKMYDRDNLDKYTENDLNSILTTYKRKLNITDLSVFISKIENQGFTYFNAKELFKSNSLEELRQYVKAFETYYRRQKKGEYSLKKLDEYINELKEYHLKDILEWAVDIFPEFIEKLRFKDILSSETNLHYGQVKFFLKTSERYKLLKYAYNIHSYQNGIKSIYNNDLINLIRFKDNKLLEQISKDTNNNIMLQERSNFELYASLHENNLKEYLKNLQRNQLKEITKDFIELYYFRTINDGKILSQKKDILESIEIINDEDLLKLALKYTEDLNFKNIQDIQALIEKYNELNVKHLIPITFRYFYNIMDFFRSTDINYLRIWLRKYELEIRKLKSERYIAGGLKNNYMNIQEYSKKELLKIFDIYFHEFPDLFYPEKFLKITGLDNGITPHKYLLENQDNEDLMLKVILSLTGHIERKKMRINFNTTAYLGSYLFDLTSLDEDVKPLLKRHFLFSVFRIINIFPELNNLELFKRLCIDEETRVLNIYELDDYYNKRNLSKIAYNIEYFNAYYGENAIQEDFEFNFNKSDEEYKAEIDKFINSPIDEEIKVKVIDGDFYSIFYSCEIFFEDDSDIVINNTYNILQHKRYIKTYVQDRYLQIRDICKAIKNFEELQDVAVFDKEYYYINITSEGYESVKDIYNYLTKVDNKKLFYYCILANFIKIDFEKKPDSRNKLKNIKDIYLKIHYMSRNEMIRYILKVAKADEDIKALLDETKLNKLIKKYFLDVGSVNTYYLTMF